MVCLGDFLISVVCKGSNEVAEESSQLQKNKLIFFSVVRFLKKE